MRQYSRTGVFVGTPKDNSLSAFFFFPQKILTVSDSVHKVEQKLMPIQIIMCFRGWDREQMAIRTFIGRDILL